MSEAIEDNHDDAKADIAAAMDQVEGASAGASIGTDQPTKEIGRPDADTEIPVRTAGEEEGQSAKTDEVETQGKPEDSQQPETTKPVKAPGRWKPAAREQWDKVPSVIQDEIHRREREVDITLQRTAESRHFHERVVRELQPFQAFIQAEAGGDMVTAMKNLAQTGTRLRIGTPQQKAQVLAGMVREYLGNDRQYMLMLDAALAGELPSEESSGIERILEQRLAPIQQFIQGIEQQRGQLRQQSTQQVLSEVDQFEAEHEFIDDVRLDMSALMDAATNRGRSMTMQQAYDIAVSQDPELSKIVKQRADKKAADEAAAKIANKRAAGTSIRGTQGAGGTVSVIKGSNNPRDDIAAAFEAHGA